MRKYSGGIFRLRKEHSLSVKFVVLGVAAIWEKRKGLDDLIRLANETDYQVIVIGAAEEQKKTLPESMICISRTNNVFELAQWYSMADVFVNPTYEDNYPTTNLEAISCGTPVITYDTGGSPESAEIYGMGS